jgi:hypothetical protein
VTAFTASFLNLSDNTYCPLNLRVLQIGFPNV